MAERCSTVSSWSSCLMYIVTSLEIIRDSGQAPQVEGGYKVNNFTKSFLVHDLNRPGFGRAQN
ncbi:hypothetical protein TRIUR3_14969 [Triticum urartu]|uniref:Uncharacterized protein n=1 Tax=Triticum urartu TaxID=4572 RepID=M7Z685_TRIUA|nr:hypothetical protein TRIUR3_14969 [Triticum urartu]